jgi:hypothetical protein
MRKGSAKFTVDVMIKIGIAIMFLGLVLVAIDRVIEEAYQRALTDAVG